MGFKEFFLDGVTGTVTILVDDLVIFQGQVLKQDGGNRHHHDDDDERKERIEVAIDPEFITVQLTCDPARIVDDDINEIEPDLFEEGDIIRINVNKIICVGPSRCCFDEFEDRDKKV